MSKVKTPEQIGKMREGGKILSAILKELVVLVAPGITTNDLELKARDLMAHHHVTPSFLGYGGYPAVLCTSVNEEAVHSVPSDRLLKEGDILKIDIGVIHGGLHTDMAVSLLVSSSSRPLTNTHKEQLTIMRVTREALYAGIAAAKAGNTIGDIGAAVQRVVESNKFVIVKELGGHGVGAKLHEEPFIPNWGEAHGGEELVAGMVIAIEPIVSNGSWKIKDAADGFGYVIKHGSLSAHFEHTIVITKKEPEILTE